MKYLDEQIIVSFSVDAATLGGSGVYQYVITDFDEGTDLFYGNTYISGANDVSIDISYFIRNMKWTPDFFTRLASNSYNKITDQEIFNSGVVKTFEVILYNKEKTNSYTSKVSVKMMYRYPLIKNVLNSGLDYDYSGYRKCWHALQGVYHIEREQYTNFVPTYPYILTDNYYGVFNVFISDDILGVSNAAVAFFTDGWSYGKRYSFGALNQNNNCLVVPLSKLFDSAFPSSEGKDGSMIVIGGKVVKINLCPAKYYLMWQDRAGSFQSQPFNGVETYSENYSREYITNHHGHKLLNTLGVSSKIKIQTGFIEDELYPYYESIFTSPYLLLYDTEEDKSYLVNVTGEYTEKTFKNQGRQFFNLQLDLEFATQQNIIY